MDTHVRGFLLRGLAAGAAGGAAAAVFLRLVTNTQISRALRFEEAIGIGLPPGEAAEFSRSTQQLGGMAAAVVYGSVLGVVLGVTLAALHHRILGRNEFERAAKVATAAFVALVLVPGLKYPPNPPAVGDPDTIDQRTVSYLLLMAASAIVVALTWRLWRRLTDRGTTGAPRAAIGGGAFLVAVALLYVIWPANPDRIAPPDNEAAAALVIADDAPVAVLGALVDTAREIDSESIRDPDEPAEALDLDRVADPSDLRGARYALSTADLVAEAYTSVVWSFRIQSIAGLALMWAVMAVTFGLLADRRAETRTGADATAAGSS